MIALIGKATNDLIVEKRSCGKIKLKICCQERKRRRWMKIKAFFNLAWRATVLSTKVVELKQNKNLKNVGRWLQWKKENKNSAKIII